MSKQKIMYCQQLAKKTFHGVDRKDAYLRAAKWYASVVLASDKFHGVLAEYIKLDDGGVVLTLWASVDESDVLDEHCQLCREMHSSFFINEDTNCNRCSAISLHKRIEWKMGIKMDYYKETLNRLIDK